MRSSQALASALGMLHCPRMTRRASRSPLPEGVTFLLEVAAEEAEALRDACALTGRTEPMLKEAAAFFIEQVLLSRHSDHFRTLGGSRDTPQSELRRNMALIMRWLHPDVASNRMDAHSLDRRLYVSRVTEAWEAIKTDERRAAYDASLSIDIRHKGNSATSGLEELFTGPALEDLAPAGRQRINRQLVIRPIRRNGFWSRVLLRLGGRS